MADEHDHDHGHDHPHDDHDHSDHEHPITESVSRFDTKTRLIVAVVALCIVAIVVALVGKALTSTKTTTQSFAGISHVDLQNANGDVTLAAAAGDATGVTSKAKYVITKPKLSQTVNGDTLVIRSKCKSMNIGPCSVKYTLSVPSNVSVTGQTDDGKITASDVKGDLVLRSNNGNVSLKSTFGKLDLRTKNGSISGSDLSSIESTAKTNNGKVQLRFAKSPTGLDAETSNGDIEIVVPKGSTAFKLDASSANGKTSSDVKTDGESPYSIKAHSDNGDVKVTKD